MRDKAAATLPLTQALTKLTPLGEHCLIFEDCTIAGTYERKHHSN